MTRRKLIRWFALFGVGLLAGCGHKETDERAHPDKNTDAGVTFNPKHGLHISSETANFIGLRVADVEERKVSFTVRFSAHIYRAASEAQFASREATASANALASASLSSSEAALLKADQPVSVNAAELKGLTGSILGVNRDLEKASGHVEVLLAISDNQARLSRGAFVSVSVPLGGETNVIAVPRSALLQTAEGNFVYTASGEHFVRTPVKVGMANDKAVEIVDGLYPGDKVVIAPVITLWLAELQSIRGGKACADGH